MPSEKTLALGADRPVSPLSLLRSGAPAWASPEAQTSAWAKAPHFCCGIWSRTPHPRHPPLWVPDFSAQQSPTSAPDEGRSKEGIKAKGLFLLSVDSGLCRERCRTFLDAERPRGSTMQAIRPGVLGACQRTARGGPFAQRSRAGPHAAARGSLRVLSAGGGMPNPFKDEKRVRACYLFCG